MSQHHRDVGRQRLREPGKRKLVLEKRHDPGSYQGVAGSEAHTDIRSHDLTVRGPVEGVGHLGRPRASRVRHQDGEEPDHT
jgi:hypothetical protein